MNHSLRFFLVVLAALSWTQTTISQVRVSRNLEGADGAFHLKELQAIITSANDTVKILMVLPTALRPKVYADVVIKDNDEILMLNKKRIKSVQTFEKMYNDLETGAEVKMGIRRDGELFLRSFKKLDPKEMPQNSNVQIRLDSEGEGREAPPGTPGMRRLVVNGEEMGDVVPLMGTGLMLKNADGRVTVGRILHTDALGESGIQAGDIIEMINGKKVESADHAAELYEKLEVGKEIELAYSRKGMKMQTTFQKPEVRGRMIIREN